jgi:mannitol/fructose-specific phosphotransferase system IIA component (Ntr-type)
MEQQNAKRVGLAGLIVAEAIKMDLTGKDRDEVLKEMIGQIKEIADKPEAKATLLHALLEREQLCSTGIGDGVALPHARNALVGLVDHAVVIFGRSKEGVHYGSIDGAPAKLFFLLLAPSVTEHLGILARLSRILRNRKLRAGLLAAETPGKVISLIREAELET